MSFLCKDVGRKSPYNDTINPKTHAIFAPKNRMHHFNKKTQL